MQHTASLCITLHQETYSLRNGLVDSPILGEIHIPLTAVAKCRDTNTTYTVPQWYAVREYTRKLLLI